MDIAQKIIDNNLFDYCKVLNNCCDHIDKNTQKRNRKIDTKKMLYLLGVKNINNFSYVDTLTNINKPRSCIENIFNMNPSSIVKYRKKLTVEHFEFIHESLLKLYYSNNPSLNNILSEYYIFAVDGSHIYINKNIKDNINNVNNFKMDNHGNHFEGFISGIYDVFSDLPIDYKIYEHTNEREALLDQLKKLKEKYKKIIIIADRGYFSDSVLLFFYENNIDFIFRIKKCKRTQKLDNFSAQVGYFNMNYKSNVAKVKLIKYRIKYEQNKNVATFINDESNVETVDLNSDVFIDDNNKYYLSIDHEGCKISKKIIIDNEEVIEIKSGDNKDDTLNDSTYYIMTSLINLNIEQIKNLYWKRWAIEVNFKVLKYNFHFNDSTLNSNYFSFINQNLIIDCINMFFNKLIVNQMERLINVKKRKDKDKDNDENENSEKKKRDRKNNNNKIIFKINNKCSTKTITEDLLKEFLILSQFKNKFKKNSIAAIKLILNNILKTKFTFVCDRKYERISKKPQTKWCYYGRKYGQGIQDKKICKIKNKSSINNKTNTCDIDKNNIIKNNQNNIKITKNNNLIQNINKLNNNLKITIKFD